MLRDLLLVAFFSTFSVGKNLPPYIKPCKRSDPNLNQCVEEHARDAISYIIKGDEEFQSPRLDPFSLPEITVDGGSGQIKVTLKDLVVKGLSGIHLENIFIDLEKQSAYAKFSLKSVTIDAHYYFDGKILQIPVVGGGPVHLDCENLLVDYSFDFKLMKKDDGKEYFDPDISPKVTYTVENVNIKLDSMFNGDKSLSGRINKFLNEHAMEINNKFSDTFAQTINVIATDNVKRIFPLVPFDQEFI